MITTSKSAKIIPHIVLIILTLVCLLPLLLLLMASLTDEQTLMLNGYSFFPEVRMLIRIFLKQEKRFCARMALPSL